jgi:hypothetical protein
MKQIAAMCGWNDPEKHSLEVNIVIGGNAES